VWRAVLRDIAPLPGRILPDLPEDAAPAAPVKPSAKPAKPAPRRAASKPPSPPAKPATPPLELGRTPGVDKRQAERLRRGRTEIDARIDLHGMTQAEAHRRLAAFIERSAAAGLRLVLVITGKGLTSEMAGRGSGVLRDAVPRWLNEPGLRPRVLAVTHAQPKDGGHGALYVLLKRAKDPRGGAK
jgi:DNA-nicking Smr family endonuclease